MMTKSSEKKIQEEHRIREEQKYLAELHFITLKQYQRI